MKLAVSTRNAIVDAIETDWGTSVRLKCYSGSAPANVTDAATGTLLADATLPADYLTAASAGVKSKSGTWNDPAADATGTVGYARIYKSDNTTCVAQFTVGTSGADLNFLSLSLTAGQPLDITSFSLTAGNA